MVSLISGAKVGEGNMCLWCNERGKAFHSTKSAQQHMLDKGHCKMLHEGDTLLEYADFYDYRWVLEIGYWLIEMIIGVF